MSCNDNYYKSENWQEKRQIVLEDWDGLCQRCEELTNHPHVHHVYGLSSDEFEILCPECHAEHHERPEIADY